MLTAGSWALFDAGLWCPEPDGSPKRKGAVRDVKQQVLEWERGAVVYPKAWQRPGCGQQRWVLAPCLGQKAAVRFTSGDGTLQ